MTESQRQRNKAIPPVSYLFSTLLKNAKKAWEEGLRNDGLESEDFAVLVCIASNY